MRSILFSTLLPCVALAQEVAPTLSQFVQAEYPPAALAAGVEGEVTFSITIDESGRVTEVIVISDPGFGLAASASVALKQFVFTPATKDGSPIRAQIFYRYRFSLTKKEKQANPALAPLDIGDGTPPITEFAGADFDIFPPGAITGTIFELGTRDPIPYAQIALYDFSKGLIKEVTAGEDGKFTIIGLVPGKLRVKIAAVGYDSYVSDEDIPQEGMLSLNFRLLPSSVGGYGLTVRGQTEEDKQVTRRVVSTKELEMIPGARGDVLKAIQNLPGMARTFLGLGGLIVRGSAPEDTQVFMDGMPIPIIYHYGGLASVISEDFITSLSFTPGVYSVKYGRGIGGIIDVETSLGEPERLEGSADVDILDTGVAVKGVIEKYDLRYAAAARRSYIDFPIGIALRVADIGVAVFPYYWDYQTALSKRVKGGEAKLMLFGSSDRFDLAVEEDEEFEDPASLKSRFHRAQFSWQKEIAPGLSQRMAASFGWTESTLVLPPDFIFLLKDLGGTARIDWASKVSDKVALRYGGEIAPRRLNSRFAIEFGDGIPPFVERKEFARLDAASYIELQYNPIDALTLSPGLRLDWLGVSKQATVDPRLTARWGINPITAIKLGAGLFHQDPKAQDFLGPDSPEPHPQYAVQAQLGAERSFWDERLSFDVSAYYKRMYRQTVRGLSFGEFPAEILTTEGEGRVAGVEFLLRYPPKERFFGWIAYSLSTAERRTTPQDEWIRFDFDQPHNVTAVGAYQFNRNFSLSWRFRVISGNPYTPVVGAQYDIDFNFYEPLFGKENSERLPAFHQLDVRFDKTYRKDRWKLVMYIEVMNVYNHRSVEFEPSYNEDFTEPKFDGVGLPIIPVIGFEGEF